MFASKSPLFVDVSSKNHHWIINEAVKKTLMFRRFAPRKDKSSLLFASKSSLFQQCFFEESSPNHQRRSKDTLKFWRLAAWKDLLSSDFGSKTSMSHQNFFEDSSTTLTKFQWSTKETSMFGRLAQHNFCWSIMFASNSPLFINVSSKNHLRNNNEAVIKTFLFRRLAPQKDESSLLFASKSSLCQQCFFEESSANHQRRSKDTWKFWRLAA